MRLQLIIKQFLYKFFCILKAASDGLIVRYIGGNQFEFISNLYINEQEFYDTYM